MAHVKDMTSGKPWRLIMLFALPLMASNVFQQVYTMVDTAVVGQFVGVEALASMGAADWLNWLVLGIPVGFAQGFSLLMSRDFGAGDYEALKHTTGVSIILSIIISAVTLLLGEVFVEPILRLMDTPENVLPGALIYLRIYFAGIPIVMAGNLVSSLLRALGDSRTPLVATVISSLTNVALDLLFTIAFGWGIPGVAVATLIAQLIAALYCYRAVRGVGEVHLVKRHFDIDKALLVKLAKLGGPVALQNTIISIGGLCVQTVINGFGFLFIAGFTATNKLYGVLEMAAVSYGYAIATYTGQNLGAERYDRIRTGIRASLVMALITSAAIGVTMILCGRSVLMIFISGEADQVAQVLEIAYRYLRVMCLTLSVLYILYVYRSALQGMGDTLIPMISGFAELVMRVGAALVLPLFMGQDGIYLAEPLAWAGAAVILVAAYYRAAARFPIQSGERKVS